jgi:hypothetical protein
VGARHRRVSGRGALGEDLDVVTSEEDLNRRDIDER